MKKLIFALLLIALFLILPNSTLAKTTTLLNCSVEIKNDNPLVSTCLVNGGKVEAPYQNCEAGLLSDNKVCCCQPQINYSCSWKPKYYTPGTGGGGVQATAGSWSQACQADETGGDDCDPAKKPSSTTSYGGRTTDYTCCCPGVDTHVEKAKFTIPQLQIPIDGLTLSTAECTGPDNTGDCAIPWIAQYITFVYNYGLGIGGILAAVVLMAGGLLWLVSGGDVSKITQAKSLILGSITGLMILFGSYILLVQINPDLISMKSISLKMLEGIYIQPIINGSDSTNNSSSNCANNNDLKNIEGIVSTSAQTPILTTVGVEGLVKAVEEARKMGVELHVTSAFRTAEHQQALWDRAMTKYNNDASIAAKYVARPGGCGGHRSGQAIDVCIKGSASCQKMGSAAFADYKDSDVTKLQEIMKAAGWKRYCGEWWHFQYQETPKWSCSP
ncbi:MAG: D-alanyl-D-alanine carboxypeptidase family protein [Patescibacteria group bacterium]|nr:D-alanyl-D-alanine carboxypeptidase family protein [Patescibacteria group bacterium]